MHEGVVTASGERSADTMQVKCFIPDAARCLVCTNVHLLHLYLERCLEHFMGSACFCMNLFVVFLTGLPLDMVIGPLSHFSDVQIMSPNCALKLASTIVRVYKE